MKEEWKDCVGYEGLYMVSNLGNVFSLKTDKIMNPCLNNDGYRQTVFRKNKIPHTVRVGRLVAQAFIPNPLNLPEVNHINYKRNDDRLENLEWVTRKENVDHSRGYDKSGVNNPRCKITESEVHEICKMLETKKPCEIYNNTKYSKSYVFQIKYKRIWKEICEQYDF